MGGQLQHAAQFGLTDEDEGGQAPGVAVELGGEQGAAALRNDEQVREKVGFIDHNSSRNNLTEDEVGAIQFPAASILDMGLLRNQRLGEVFNIVLSGRVGERGRRNLVQKHRE